MTSLYRDETIQDLSASLVGRNDVVNRWGNAISSILMLPGLRGCWPMSAIDNAGNAFDQSGNGRTLSYNGNPTYNVDNNFVPYIDLDGTGDFLSRADEAGLDILGTESYVASALRGLTMGGWFWGDSFAVGNTGMMSKWGTTTVSGAYMIYALNGVPTFIIESAAGAFSQEVGTGWTDGAWHFVVGRYTPSSEVAIWIDDDKDSSATAIASLRNNAIQFEIGNWSTAGLALDGRASLCWLSTAALPDSTIIGLFEQQRVLFGV